MIVLAASSVPQNSFAARQLQFKRKASSVNIHLATSFAKIISPKEEKYVISTLVERKEVCSFGRYHKDPEEEY